MSKSNIEIPSGPLDRQTVMGLRKALIQLRTLQGNALVTPNSDAEKAGLSQYLASMFLGHAEEFIGTWFAAKEEYEPIIQGFAGLLRRSGALNAEMFKRQQEAVEAAKAKAGNPPSQENIMAMPTSDNKDGAK